MKILILGVTGMLGSALWFSLQNNKNYEVWGTLRTNPKNKFINEPRLIYTPDILNYDNLIELFDSTKPDVVINCIGLIKQHDIANDPLVVLPINSIFPHRLANLCKIINARLIHISTDCVFSGKQGNYLEGDISDAQDLYGKSKFIGEISNLKNAITLRTSIIGHELNSHHSLIDWFLNQHEEIKGYTRAIYTGVPTFELARIIENYVIPNSHLSGLYHVASSPINKYELLKIVSQVYDKKINIVPDDQINIDRSLNAENFNSATGYKPSSWHELVKVMFDSQKYYKEPYHV